SRLVRAQGTDGLESLSLLATPSEPSNFNYLFFQARLTLHLQPHNQTFQGQRSSADYSSPKQSSASTLLRARLVLHNLTLRVSGSYWQLSRGDNRNLPPNA